jgi:hypothetical protein
VPSGESQRGAFTTVRSVSPAPSQQLRHRLRSTREVLTAPRVRIELFGSDEARRAYEHFTSPHPRVRVIASKSWGAALLPLPATFDGYLGGGSRALLRQKRRRALSLGYEVRAFDGLERLDEVMEINRSAPERQGIPMLAGYLDDRRVGAYLGAAGELMGAFAADGRLSAYAHVPQLGDVASLYRLMGHADRLDDGIVYLLVSDVVAACLERRDRTRHPQWLMYDMFWGAAPGMRYFKRRLGFRPYRVEWAWRA